MGQRYLVYGAYGYSGELICRQAVQRGHQPILAGRRREPLDRLAGELGLEARAFALDDPEEVRRGLRGVAAVLHCAGPFVHTFRAVFRACLDLGVHYLDITGEAAVFESLAARSRKAEAAGIVCLPGSGFDVVPSDCLALHLKERLPDARRLALGIAALGRLSRGTAATMAENVHRGGLVRREGKLRRVPPAWRRRRIDFGRGKTDAVSVPWGDVATAYHTTGIPDIEVYFPMPALQIHLLSWSRWLAPVLRLPTVQSLLRRRLLSGSSGASGPSPEERARGHSWLWGEVVGPDDERAVARLETPEGYDLTARTAVEIAERVLDAPPPPGFHTPAGAFGADFILGFEGVEGWKDEE